MDEDISGDTASKFKDPQQLVDFSYIPKINALLEDINEQLEDYSADDTTDQSMDTEDPQTEDETSDQDMDISGTT